MSDDYEDRIAKRREEERQYHNDVWYEVWRSGGNPDAISPERVQDAFYNGAYSQDAAAREIRSQRQSRNRHEEQYDEQYPE